MSKAFGITKRLGRGLAPRTYVTANAAWLVRLRMRLPKADEPEVLSNKNKIKKMNFF